MTSRTLVISVSPQARVSYLALASIGRRTLSTSPANRHSGQYHRSDFTGQGFTGVYEAGQPTNGPLGGASVVGAPRITPKTLKQHLDQFVVGQERAKKVLSSAVYNHYQRIRELQRQEDEQAELEQQALRREMAHRHPVEDEFPGQQPTMKVFPAQPPSQDPPPSSSAQDTSQIVDYTPLQIEKSNVLLLGPSGVGKTLMTKTLARVLDVPFSISDCTPFTQAGYIGDDVEVCVQRLLAAANYDIASAEQGIICLDEIDKIAATKFANGKDVGGEGVQQALLKIIEGTTLQIQAKPERGSGRGPGNSAGNTSGFSSGNPLDSPRGPSLGGSPPPSGGKGEVFNVRTDNILFICTGAFVGLEKPILDRISHGSIGFGAAVRSSKPESGSHETMLRGEDALFKKHLPFYVAEEPVRVPNPYTLRQAKPTPKMYNVLDLVEPSDLQKYGMIPELVGRIPISCAVSALDEEALARVLTEPRNSLLRQMEQLFQLSGVELRFTSSALRAVAKSASGMGTGARGLRTVLERLLENPMFETPGSHVKHVLITQDVAQRKCAPLYFQRGQSHNFHATIAQEEEKWDEELRRKEGTENVGTFEEYRKRGLVAGAGAL